MKEIRRTRQDSIEVIQLVTTITIIVNTGKKKKKTSLAIYFMWYAYHGYFI